MFMKLSKAGNNMFKYILSFCVLIAGTSAFADGVIINGEYHNVQRLSDDRYIIDGEYHNVQRTGSGYLDNGEYHNSRQLSDDSYLIDGNLYRVQR